MSTANEFVIFWNTNDGQEESLGIYLYGLYKANTLPQLPSLIEDAWKAEGVETQINRIDSEFGSVLIVSVKLDVIPAEDGWRKKIEASLTAMIEHGACVTWAGGEDCTWSPEVLNRTSGAGNVYAAKSISTGLVCNDKFGKPMQFLTDEQLYSLWNIVLRFQ